MSNNCLVVGVNGMIGSALFARLQSSDKNSSVWGTTHRQNIPQQSNVFQLNLADPSSWHFPEVDFDVAYLCAGVCRMALCEEDPRATHRVNVEGMTALAQILSDKGAFIVYLSTNQVFSGETPFVPVNAPYQPVNEYGRQKALMEEYLRKNCPQSAIVRLTKVVEPNMSLIADWTNRLLQHQPVEAFHDMMLAPVALRDVLEMLQCIGEKKQGGIYHVSGPEDVSYFDVARWLAQQLGRSTSLVKSVSALEKGIQKSFLPRFTTLDSSSTIARCGLHPPVFADVLQECFSL